MHCCVLMQLTSPIKRSNPHSNLYLIRGHVSHRQRTLCILIVKSLYAPNAQFCYSHDFCKRNIIFNPYREPFIIYSTVRLTELVTYFAILLRLVVYAFLQMTCLFVSVKQGWLCNIPKYDRCVSTCMLPSMEVCYVENAKFYVFASWRIDIRKPNKCN